MQQAYLNGWSSFLRLCRFLIWYGILVAVAFYLLPLAGLFLEDQYEAMSSAAKFLAVIGFFLVIVFWQVIGWRDRARNW